MKRYFWTMCVVALFAIGFAASDEEDGTKEQSAKSKESTEMVDEKKENSKKEKETSKLSPKEQAIADAAYSKGSMFGMVGADNETFSNMLDLADYVEGGEEQVNQMLEKLAGDEYDMEYNAPTTAEERRLKKIYVEYFIKGMNGTMDSMDLLDKLGSKK